MTFTERINLDIKNAMLAREKEKLAALRDIKSKLLLEATAGADTDVSEETALKLCMKLHKQRMETYALYQAQQREDLDKRARIELSQLDARAQRYAIDAAAGIIDDEGRARLAAIIERKAELRLLLKR